MTDFKVK